MRELCLILVVANLALLGWRHWLAPPPPPPSASEPESTLPSLQLVSELRAEPTAVVKREEPETTVPAVAILAPPSTPRCVALGPFLDLAEATEAAARLRGLGLASNQRLAESQIWVGHWVYLLPFDSRAAAVEAVETLRRNQVDDLYIEPGGDMRHAVSLGVFSDEARAQSRLSEIGDLGFAPVVRDRFRLGSVYWVDFEKPADVEIVPSDFASVSGREIRLDARPCEPGARIPGL